MSGITGGHEAQRNSAVKCSALLDFVVPSEQHKLTENDLEVHSSGRLDQLLVNIQGEDQPPNLLGCRGVVLSNIRHVSRKLANRLIRATLFQFNNDEVTIRIPAQQVDPVARGELTLPFDDLKSPRFECVL